MKHIPLTKGMIAIVDDNDYERVSSLKWYARCDGYNWYAVREDGFFKKAGITKSGLISMHRFVLNVHMWNVPIVDHINGNTLDNRKQNLRLASDSQSRQNTGLGKNNKSGYKGVSWHKGTKKWVAQISVNHRKICIGYFDVSQEAAKAYDEKARELFGHNARTNF